MCLSVVMQTGFAFLQAGSVRSKNMTSILYANIMNATVGCLAYWACGYAFAFGNGNGFIGNENFFLSNTDLRDRELVRWFLEYACAITVATIVNGAMAERMNVKCYLIFSFYCTGNKQNIV